MTKQRKDRGRGEGPRNAKGSADTLLEFQAPFEKPGHVDHERDSTPIDSHAAARSRARIEKKPLELRRCNGLAVVRPKS
eukprot:scaffold261_cov58-Cyclotella_meneghiniana.AAC.1